MTAQLEGRTALVTGASRGIGRALALELARAGAHIIALARTQGGLEDLDDAIKAAGGSATLVPASITDYDALERLRDAIHQRWQKLDLLAGNAGVLGTLSPVAHISPKTWDEVMAVNVTANYRLIRALEPVLALSEQPRAVFVTSGAAHKCRAYWGAYSVSKAALEALVRTWAAEMETTAIKVNLLNPGPVATRMRRQAMPGEDQATLPTPDELAGAALELFLPATQTSGRIYDFADGRLTLHD